MFVVRIVRCLNELRPKELCYEHSNVFNELRAPSCLL